MVVLQQRHAAVSVIERHVGLNGTDVSVDLTGISRQSGLQTATRYKEIQFKSGFSYVKETAAAHQNPTCLSLKIKQIITLG